MLDAVIDLSHHNAVSSFSQLKEAGVLAVLHKATQGTGYVDPTFAERRKAISAAGLLFGSYHFGTGGDAEGQAEHYLQVTGHEPLLVLDFEENPAGSDMSLAEAEQFVRHVKLITGRYPGLYSGHTLAAALAAAGITKPGDTELSQCWLWLARYGHEPTLPPLWTSWSLWQYTDGAAGETAAPLPGIGRCDRDRFNGTVEQLHSFWRESSGQ